MDTRGWPERWDELEEKADPSLMPLIISLRADMELFAAAAVRLSQMGGLALKQRQQILDAQSVLAEWSED
jgi:hypothetical protein